MKSARSDLQLNLPPAEVLRADSTTGHGPEIGQPHDLPEISFEMAKSQIGKAFERSIGGLALKELGDSSHVRRVCDGEIPGPLARAWQRPANRKALIRELADASGLFDVRMTIDERRRA